MYYSILYLYLDIVLFSVLRGGATRLRGCETTRRWDHVLVYFIYFYIRYNFYIIYYISLHDLLCIILLFAIYYFINFVFVILSFHSSFYLFIIYYLSFINYYLLFYYFIYWYPWCHFRGSLSVRGARGVRGILGMPGTRGVRSILSMGVRVSRIFFSFFLRGFVECASELPSERAAVAHAVTMLMWLCLWVAIGGSAVTATCLNCTNYQLGNDNMRCVYCIAVVRGCVRLWVRFFLLSIYD